MVTTRVKIQHRLALVACCSVFVLTLSGISLQTQLAPSCLECILRKSAAPAPAPPVAAIHTPSGAGGAVATTLQDEAFSKLELFLSAYPGDDTKDSVNGFNELQSSFIRSLEFFWPRNNLRVTVALDETVYTNEQEQRDMTTRMKSSFSPNVQENISVVYNPLTNTTLYGTGWYIQQLIMFWADNFTSAEYIGFVDDDTLFTRAVQPIDLFDERGRPRVIASEAKHGRAIHIESAAIALKRPPKLYSMTYFPVIIKREHLIKVRQAILQLHYPKYNTFDEFFTAIIHRSHKNMAHGCSEVCQFCIMMDYVFEHYRDEYSWHLDAVDTQGLLDHGTGADAAAGDALLQPFPRVALHASYMFQALKKLRHSKTKAGRRAVVSGMLRRGYCYSLPWWSLALANSSNNDSSNTTTTTTTSITELDKQRCQRFYNNIRNDKIDVRVGWKFEQGAARWMEINITLVQVAHTAMMQRNRARQDWDATELQTIFGPSVSNNDNR